MADFDSNLNPIIKQSSPSDITLNVAVPKKPVGDISFSSGNGGGVSDLAQQSDVFADLDAFTKNSNFGEKGVFATNKELDSNKRYATFNPTISNYEDFVAYGQSNWDRAANGLLKGLNLAGTTVAGSFGMLYGGTKALFTGRMADVWDNEIMRELDDWNTKVDQEYLPNYYTDAEKNASWYSTDNWFTTNFLFDKLIKNSGFAVGAMISGNIANAGLKGIGSLAGKGLASAATIAESSQAFKLFTPLLRNTSRAFSVGQNVEAAAILESQISSIADLTAKSSKIAQIAKTTNLLSKINDVGRRSAIAVYSSAGEASFEALHTSKEFRENLISEYVSKYGEEPTGDELKEIDLLSESVGKTAFFGNMALLSATEYVQLPYLLGSSYRATKQAANSFGRQIDDIALKEGQYVAKTPTSRIGKVASTANRISKYAFDPKEAYQELSQYALQIGTQNYFKKSYLTDDADVWTDGFLYGFSGVNERGQSVGALNSKEGIESAILGGITGGLMQVKGRIQEQKATTQNTQQFLNTLNTSPSFKQVFQDKLNSVNRGVVLQQQYEDAVIEGNELEARDAHTDMMFNYLSTRVKYGRMDMISGDINDLRNDGSTEEGLASLKQQGLANLNDTVSSYQERLSSIERRANSIDKFYESFNLRYSGVLDQNNLRVYSPEAIDGMVYSASKIEDYDLRIPQVSSPLLALGIDLFPITQGINTNNEAPRKPIKAINQQIEALKSIREDELKELFQDVVELISRRKKFVDDFNQIKKDPSEFYNAIQPTVSTNEIPSFTNNEEIVEPLELGRQYSIADREAKVRKVDNEEQWEVISPTGNFLYDTIEEATTKQKEVNSDLADTTTVEILSINPDGSVQIKDVNGDIYSLPLSSLTGYEKIRTSQEKLQKYKEDLDKVLSEVERESATIGTNDVATDISNSIVEEKKKATNILFTSTTSQSEDIRVLKPHAIRTNTFLNNLKNFSNYSKIRTILVTPNQENSLGLSGLSDLSLEGTGMDKSKYTDINEGLVAAVYVEQDGNNVYFVDNEGKRISKVGEQIDLNKVVFSTMPTTHLVWVDGKTPRYRSGEREEAVEQSKRWEAKRKELFSKPEGQYEIYEFSVSRGIPVDNETDEVYNVGDNLIPKEKISTQENLIVIPTTGTIFHNGQLLKFPNGRPVLQYEDTLQSINNKPFTSSQANVVYEILNSLSKDVKDQQAKNVVNIKLNRNYLKFLQNVLYFRKSANTSKNQIFIDTTTMELFFSGDRYNLTNIEESRNTILNKLKEVYFAVNNVTLKGSLSEPFIEYYINDENELTTREWVNYQTFLLSSSLPDGSKRSVENTPLSTNVPTPSESIPYNYKQKYAILQGMELPVLKVDKPVVEVVKKETPVIAPSNDIKIGEHVIDGTTINTYTLKNGPVQFTASLDVDGNVEVSVNSNDTITKIVADPNTMSVVSNALKAANQFDATQTNEQLVLNFVAIRIASDLQKQKASVVVPKVEQETKKETSLYNKLGGDVKISNIDKEVEIERRRSTTFSTFTIEKKGNQLYEYYLTPDGRTEQIYGKTEKEVRDKINTKYDAELLTLKQDGAKIEVTTPLPTKKEFNKTIPPANSEYRREGVNDIERISNAEIELFKEWHSKNTPNIPYDILENILITHDGEKAWGAFENNVAKFYRSASRGTEYHEIFEGIWASFLTQNERQALLDEFKNKSGQFTDRQSGKKINYDQATDHQAKERITDDFADFRLGKLPARSLGEKILRFFKSIIEFFKLFVQKPSLKEQLFKDIDTGKFKDAVIPDNQSIAPEWRRVEGLTEQQTNEFVQDITARFFQNVFGTNTSLFNPNLLTAPEIFNNIKNAYSEEGKLELLGDNTWNQLEERTKDYLRTFKIEFDENNVLSINNEEQNKADYAPEPFSTDWKKSSSFPVKLLTGTLTETAPDNQENSNSLSLPAQKLSSVNGYKLLNFSRAFSTLLERLGNTTDINSVVDKIVQLAKTDSNYVRLFTRLGGNREKAFIDFGKFNSDDWRLFVNFYQTFTKQKPEAYIQYITNGEVYSSSANLASAVRTEQRSWIENMKNLSKKKDSLIKYNSSTKTYQVGNPSSISIKTPQEQVAFLSKIGVEFPMEVYNKLKTFQRKKFADSTSAIYAYINSNKDIMSVKGETLGINGQLTTLAELLVNVTNPNQEISYFGLDGRRRQSFSDNNAASVLENDFNSVDTLEELLEKRPELNDVFSGNSVVLKRGGQFFNSEGKRIKEIKLGYIQGTNNIDSGKETMTSALSLGDRYIQEINQNLNGNYYVLIPADSSTEWMMNLGNSISFSDIETGDAWNKIYSVFRGYLRDDINLAKENRSYLKNVGSKGKELRFFKDILNEKNLNKLNSLLKEEATNEEIELYISENISDINSAVKEFIENGVNTTKEVLIQSNHISQIDETIFKIKNLDDNFTKKENISKFNLSEKEVNDILLFTEVNYIINNAEFHKILFGDPYQFAIKNGQLDETKRIKSFLSPRRITFDSPEYNTFLNQNYNKAGEITLSSTDPGYHIHKPYTNTVTLQDVTVYGSIASMQGVSKEIKDAYAKTNEADAFSFIMDTTYREVKLKNGQWSEDAENWHQWEMAYTRQNIPGYEYANKVLEKHDIKLLSSPKPKFTIEVLKPIVSGGKEGKNNIDITLDKMSQMPLYYSAIEGTNLEKLYNKLWKEDIGYAVFESGRKVGAEKLETLYTEDGGFNESPFENIIPVSWKAYGIQVENSYEGAKEQTRGSQLTKLSSLDLASNGVFSSEIAQKEYKRNISILNEMHKNGYKNLLNSLGIEDLNGSFSLVDKVSVSQTLQRELLRREASENLKDILQLDENGEFRIPFEASASYIQIKDILYSMVDKAVVSPKMSGGAHVQVPSTLWENAKEGRRVVTVNGKKVLTSDHLKFYTKEDPYCEILLPAWFKDKINPRRFKTDTEILNYLNKSQEGKDILKGIGFRIPTQATSSVEVFRVKGFLPSYMGSTVVVPSEITTKAGSDFDIDKLNMYLKAIYSDVNGDIKLVKYKGSEEETKEFYGKIFDKKLEKSKISKSEMLEALQVLHYGLEDPKGLINKYGDILNTIVEDSEQASDFDLQEEKLVQKLEQLGDENLQSSLRIDFVNEMYKRSLENEYYDSLEKLLTLPENFDRLISPVGDAGLKDTSNTLDKLMNIDETNIKNRILNRSFMTSIRHAFVTGKKWVGVAAVNITGHSLAQKSEIYIDPFKFQYIPEFDQKILGDGVITLPHNITKEGFSTLSGKMTADGKEFISDRLSGYATAFVDVAKDPYILKIIKSDLAIGTFMFLERIGAGKNTALFMNQPIIQEYLKYLDSINSRSLYNKENLNYIRSQFITSEPEYTSAKIDIKDLSGNIHEYYEKGYFYPKSSNSNAVQLKVLDEFLKYSKMAEFMLDLNMSSNYDTTSFRSQDRLFLKQIRTKQAREYNIFSSVDKLMDSSHIGEQSFILAYASEAIGEVLKLDRYEVRSKGLNPILEPFAKNKYLSIDKYDRIANRIITSLIDYSVQTQSGLNTEIQSLLVSTNSVANDLAQTKQQYPQLRILKDLEIVSGDRPDATKSIKLKANIKEAYDENLYTEMMRELRDFPATNNLYNNIVKLSILQGTYQSSISISNIIPIEDRSAIMAPILNKLRAEDLGAFSQGAFQRNNWKNEDVFRKVMPKFFSTSDGPIGEDVYGNEIYQYISPAFPGIQSFGIKPSERKILQLNEKYNSFDVKSDYIIVPRVIEDRSGEKIDMVTGRTVTNSMFVQRKLKGDYSLQDVYGYKKVKYSNGQPVLTFDKEGNSIYIYKLINLWGDGMYASEYYETNKPSVLNNGTMKITQEIPDSDIINFYAPTTRKSNNESVNPEINNDNLSEDSSTSTIPKCS